MLKPSKILQRGYHEWKLVMNAKQTATFKANLVVMAVLLVGVIVVPLTSGARARAAPESKRILVLYWDDRQSQADDAFAHTFRSVVESAPAGTVEYYSEYLEASRFPGENQSLLVRDYLRKKYADRRIDVVVAAGGVPLGFLLKYRNDLFTNTPIVFFGTKRPTATELASGPGMTGIVILNAYRRTLDLALSLHPGTKHVFIVSGTLDHDKEYETLCREELRDYDSAASIDYLTDLPPAELSDRVRGLPERSLVLYIWQQSRTGEGKTLETHDVLALIAPATTTPIYGVASWQVGRGIVGGYVRTTELNGKRTAEIALRVANGERAQDIPVENIPVVPMFDSRELRRWRISEDLLPSDSILRFRVPSFWDEYKWYAIAAIAVLILQSMLIGGLVINRSMRKRAEVERERFASIAVADRLRLDEVVSHVPGIVWEAYPQPGEAGRETVFVSDYAAKMLGYSVEEWASTPGFAQSIIHPEDRDYVAHVTEAILKDGSEAVLQFRWMARDGRELWAEAHLAATRDQTRKIIGIRGITIDITERKWATEALHQIQESFTIALEASQMGTWDLDLIKDFSGHRSLRHDQIFGYDAPPTDWGREVARRQIVEEDRATYDAAFARAMLTGDLDFEARVRWPDESIHWMAARGRFYFDENGQATRGAGVNYDITDRKRAEESLRIIEERNRAILRAIPDLMFINTADGVYLDYQANDTRDLLVPPSEFLGKNIRQVFAPELAEAFLSSFRRAQEHDEPQSVEYTLQLNGEERWFEARIVTTQGDKVLSVVRDITDRKQAEEHLRESEARRLLAQQAARIGTFEFNFQTGVNLWSPELEEIHGLQCGSFTGTEPSWEDLVHPDDLARALASVLQAFKTGAPVEEEWRVTWLDGSIHWIFGRFQVFPDSTGKPLKLAGINIDITNRKVTEDALRESQARLAGIVGSAMDAIISIGESRRIVLFNAAAEKMFGCDAQQALGQELNRFLPKRVRATDGKYVRAFRDRNETTSTGGSLGTIYGRRANGEEFPIEASISELDLKGQKFYTVILRDITMRRRTIEALRESEERFRTMADTAPVMIWVAGADKLCTYCNQQWLDFTGRTMEQEIGNGWAEGVHPEDVERCLEIYNNAFDRRDGFTMEYRLRRADGQFRWVFDTGAARFSPGAGFLGYIGSCLDITERRASEEALANLSGQLIRAREEECARIARELHDDVNQRMALVSIELEQLGQKPDTPDELRRQLKGLLSEISETSTEIHRMSRDLHPSKLVHLGLVPTLKSLFEELHQRHGLRIKFKGGNLPSNISQDVSLCLYRTVQECLNNVIKHSGAEACAVELRQGVNEIRLRVSDSGAGFDIESPSIQKGLGLISMRERLRLVGGSISIDSKPSLGTKIDARVPFGREGLEYGDPAAQTRPVPQ